MGSAGVLLLLVLSAAIATGVVAYIIIINRCKRQQAQISAGKRQREAEEECQRREAEEAQWKAEEERQRCEAEEAQRRAEGERQRREADEAQRKAEEECQCCEVEEAQRRVEEERLRREAEEAQQKAEEDRQRHEAEEAQRKTEEERLCCEAEKAQQKAEEERQRHEAEDAQRKAEEDRQPEVRGGRPRIPTLESKEQVDRQSKLHQPKPEIVCWQRERRWILAVEAPEDLWGKPELVVHQNASPLAPDEHEGYWRLNQVCGQVTVHWIEDEAPQEAVITLGEENYLLFKLSGQEKQGHRVKFPSSGSYLVMVPESWERDEKFSGSPPASPQPVSVEGCQGHFFDLEKGGDKRISFRTSEGESVQVKLKAARFKLVGAQLDDASEGVGHLFGEKPPRIRALQEGAWTDIGTIVIGEEGSKKGRWRKSFSPTPEGREQNLPAEATPEKDGWYFLRFYDTNDDLVESLDFRFVIALREIRILQPSPFPSEGEHESVCVEFHHDPGFVIQPVDDLARSVQIESKENKTLLTIPPEPLYDETQWHVGSQGKPQVYITVLIERLWWAVSPENDPPSEWKDKLLTLAGEDFVPTSKKALWVRLPRRRWADKVLIGFEQSRTQSCPVKIAEKVFAKPLRDFGDYQEIRESDRDHFFSVWIERDSELVEGIVAIIPASKGPILCIERGKKEKAIATAVLRKGTGAITVNGRPLEGYFERAPLKAKQFLWRLLALPHVREALSQMEVSIEVTGSNPSTVQQVKASAHALARALMKYDSRLRPLLRRFEGVKVKKT